MTIDPKRLINGHLDCSLSSDEQVALNDWIKADSENADRFVRAVMLHNRIHVQYQSLKATLEHLDHIRIAAAPRLKRSRRLTIGASIVCLLLAFVLYFGTPSGSNPTATAVAEFHELVIQGRKPGDRTYRVTFVKDRSDTNEKPFGGRGNDPKPPVVGGRDVSEAWLYVRDGRQFVYRWKSVDGLETINGRNASRGWSIRNDQTVAESDNPLEFTSALPGGKEGIYLSPILSFFDGQEKLLVADYNIEMRRPTPTTSEFIAAKKPDTIQGPRRIEIVFPKSAGQVSAMKIWPETPDHRKTGFTLIELVSEDPLAADWFTPAYHTHAVKRPGPDTAGAAD